MVGTFGQFGIMSFNGNKMITTSGGGALICPDEESKKKVMFYATQAREQKPYYLHEEIGFNYRMSNVCAGIGRGQMTVADAHIKHHQRIAHLYADAFRDIEEIKVHLAPEAYMEPNYWLSTITFEKSHSNGIYGVACEPNEQVKRSMQALSTVGIESRPLWKPMHSQPVYKGAPAYVDGTSERLFQKGLCLPSGPCVTDEDIEMIVKTLKESVVL
jgi:dTDP-4-amino-4,6-dideoxygalactose transaminase